MSLILEALKKAERQHRLGEVPGIGSSPLVENPSSNRWMVLVLLLAVALGMLLLGIYLGRPAVEPSSAIVQERAKTPGASMRSEAIPLGEPQSNRQAAPVTKRQAGDSLPPIVLEPGIELPPPPVSEEETAEVIKAVPKRSVQIPESPATAKPMSELPDGFVFNMPQLNIDIHSYDERAGLSYVLINMQKYREGEYLAEGPLLTKILPDGVILEYMGERFILPIGNY